MSITSDISAIAQKWAELDAYSDIHIEKIKKEFHIHKWNQCFDGIEYEFFFKGYSLCGSCGWCGGYDCDTYHPNDEYYDEANEKVREISYKIEKIQIHIWDEIYSLVKSLGYILECEDYTCNYVKEGCILQSSIYCKDPGEFKIIESPEDV